MCQLCHEPLAKPSQAVTPPILAPSFLHSKKKYRLIYARQSSLQAPALEIALV